MLTASVSEEDTSLCYLQLTRPANFTIVWLFDGMSSIGGNLKSKTKWGLPWWLSGREPACQCRGHRLDPRSGRVPHAAERLSPSAAPTDSPRAHGPEGPSQGAPACTPGARAPRAGALQREWDLSALRWRAASAPSSRERPRKAIKAQTSWKKMDKTFLNLPKNDKVRLC